MLNLRIHNLVLEIDWFGDKEPTEEEVSKIVERLSEYICRTEGSPALFCLENMLFHTSPLETGDDDVS